MQEESLAVHLKGRPAELRKAKKKGIKVIGYFPGNYVPEEIIHAAFFLPQNHSALWNYYFQEL